MPREVTTTVECGRPPRTVDDVRFAATVKPGEFYFVDIEENSEANKECLMMGYHEATLDKKIALVSDVEAKGVWFYRWNETADSTWIKKRPKEQQSETDEVYERIFPGPPILHEKIDKFKVYLSRNRGDFERTVPVCSLKRRTSVKFGWPPRGGKRSLWCVKIYDEAFMTYETHAPVHGGAALGRAGRACVGDVRPGKPKLPPAASRGDSTYRSIHSHSDGRGYDQGENRGASVPVASGTENRSDDKLDTRRPPRHLRGPAKEVVGASVSLGTYFSATGTAPSDDLLQQLHEMLDGQRAPHPDTRPWDPDDMQQLDLCCGAGGSAHHVPASMLHQIRDWLRQGADQGAPATAAQGQGQGLLDGLGTAVAGSSGQGTDASTRAGLANRAGGHTSTSAGIDGGVGAGVNANRGRAAGGGAGAEASSSFPGGNGDDAEAVAAADSVACCDDSSAAAAAAGPSRVPLPATAAGSDATSGRDKEPAVATPGLGCRSGAGGAAIPEEGPKPVPQVRTMWACDISTAALLSYIANQESTALPLACRVEEAWALVVMGNELLTWLESPTHVDGPLPRSVRDNSARRSQQHGTPRQQRAEMAEAFGAGGDRLGDRSESETHPQLDKEGFKSQSEFEREEAKVTAAGEAAHRDIGQVNDPAEVDDNEGHMDEGQHLQEEDRCGKKHKPCRGNAEAEEEWAVQDIWGIQLCHNVPFDKGGQLEKELQPGGNCELKFLVEWAYDPDKDAARWRDYPAGRLEWVRLQDINCWELLLRFMQRLLLVEVLLPRRGMQLRVLAGCPCQELTGHNIQALSRPVFGSVKNKIVLSVLKLAVYLKVKHLLLEQVPDAARRDDGIWLRMVQALLNLHDYQHRTCVVHAAGHGVPQVRPRIFIIACSPDAQLPPVPRPEFCARMQLPLLASGQPLVEKRLRRIQRSLLRCYPTAGEGALMYPSQTLADAISNLEPRSNYSMSPVTCVNDLKYPLQHVLTQPPPEGTPPVELRFAVYLGNSAPAVLAFARSVLYAFFRERIAAEALVRRRVRDRARRALNKAAAGGSAAAASGPPPAVASPRGRVRPQSSAPLDAAAGNGGTQQRQEAKEEAFVRVGRLIAELAPKGKGAADKEGHQDGTQAQAPDAPPAGQATRKRSAAAAAAQPLKRAQRESYLQVGQEAVGCAVEALQRAIECAPHYLNVLKRELVRMEGGADDQANTVPGGSDADSDVVEGDMAHADAARDAVDGDGGSSYSGACSSGSNIDPSAALLQPRLPVLAANHLSFPLGVDDYERVKLVPRRPSACWRDMQGAGGSLPSGAPVLPKSLDKRRAKQAKLKDGSVQGMTGASGPPAQRSLGGQPFGRLSPFQVVGTVCGSSRTTKPEKESQLHDEQCRMLTPREHACIQGFPMHTVFLSTESPFLAELRKHSGLLSRSEALIKPAIRGLEWLLAVGPAALAGTDNPEPARAAKSGATQRDGHGALHPCKLKAAWQMLRRVVANEGQQVGNSWPPPVAQAFGRCLALALCGVASPSGQATVPDPAWKVAWQWAEGRGLLCAQAELQGRPGLWVAGPEEGDEPEVFDEDLMEEEEEEEEEEDPVARSSGDPGSEGEEDNGDEEDEGDDQDEDDGADNDNDDADDDDVQDAGEDECDAL